MSDPTLPPPQPIPMSPEERQLLLKEMLHKVKDATDTESTIRRLTAERDAALVDARRYRKLCELAEFGEWCIGKNTILDSWGLTSTEYMDDKADADKQLDAAMKESGND